MRIIITTLLLIPWLVSAQTSTANIQATVPEHGQVAPVKINISADQTEQFTQLYGVHSSSDSVYSEISLIVAEFILIWILFLLINEGMKKYTEKNNKKQDKLVININKLK